MFASVFSISDGVGKRAGPVPRCPEPVQAAMPAQNQNTMAGQSFHCFLRTADRRKPVSQADAFSEFSPVQLYKIGKTMDHLIRWSEQDDWAQCQSDILADHFDPISEMYALHDHEIIDLIGDAAAPLFAFIMEDFFTAQFGDRGEKNIVDSYLGRHGWRENIQGKRYLKALKFSTAMLYEICDLEPARTVTVRDLILGGDPVAVADSSLLDSAERGDCFAGRLLDVDEKPYLTTGLLYYPRAAARSACRTLDAAADRFVEHVREEVMRCVEEEGEGADDATLRRTFYFGGHAETQERRRRENTVFRRQFTGPGGRGGNHRHHRPNQCVREGCGWGVILDVAGPEPAEGANVERP